MRQAHDAGRNLVADLERHADLADARAKRTRSPLARLRPRRRVGCISSVHASRPFTRRWLLCIQELLLRRCRRPTRRSSPSGASRRGARRRGTSARNCCGARCTRWSPVCSGAGRRGSSGPRSTPWGCFSSSLTERRCGRCAGRRRGCGAGRGAASSGPRRRRRARRAARCDGAREVRGRPSRRARRAGRRPASTMVTLRTATAWRSRSSGRARDRSGGQEEPARGASSRCGRDRATPSGRALERPAEARTVGHGRDRVAGERDQRADVSRLNLLGEARDRELAAELGEAAHRLVNVPKLPRCPSSAPRRTRSTAGVVNIAPPARSRLPVSTLSTTTSHADSPPNSCWQTPTRP